MSVKFERETLKQTAQKVMASAVPEAGKIPGTGGKHPIAEKVGTALTGGFENAGTKGYLAVCRVRRLALPSAAHPLTHKTWAFWPLLF